MIGLKILNLSGTDLGRDPKTIRELFKQMVFHYSVTLEELRLRGCGLYNSSLEIAWLGVQDGLKDNKTRPIDERRLIMLQNPDKDEDKIKEVTEKTKQEHLRKKVEKERKALELFEDQ